MAKDVNVKSTSKRGKDEQKSKVGRPSSYVKEVADDICHLLAQGESLRKICQRPGMPNKSTIARWLIENKEFCDQYARARESQADFLLDELLEIADCASPEDVQVAKLRVDSRKWYITKVAPKKYGDRVTQEHTGADGKAIQVEVRQELDLSGYSFDELEQLEAILTRRNTAEN